jgi:two-component system LytT family response regulator
MPECDGFDVIEMLGRDVPPAVVFVTAYDRYALQAFEAGALDYLLKPFDDSRFHRTMSRIKERFAAEKNRFWKPDRLAIKNAGEIIFLNLTEIDWIEAADYYAAIHVGSKTHLLRRTLAELEQELDPAVFCRIHRSAIVNLERVQALGTGLDGEYTVILKTGTTLRLSRRYRRLIQTSLAPRSLGL